MAKKIFTIKDRVIDGTYIRATPDAPVEVTFPKGFDPLGRTLKVKGKATEFKKRKQQVTSPKGERFEIDVEYPVEIETVVEKYVPYTDAELGALGLIVREEKDERPVAQGLKPHHAGTAGGPPSAAEVQGPKGGAQRPSDREP